MNAHFPTHTTATRRKRFSTDVVAGPICKLCGVDWTQIVADSATALSTESKSGTVVYADEYIHLWNALSARSKIENFSQCIGARMSSGPVAPVLLGMSSAPNFMTGLQRLNRFEHIFGPIAIRMTRTDARFEIELKSVDPDVELPHSFSAAQIIYMQSSCRHLAVRPYAPISVRIPLPRQERDRLVDLFGYRPDYGTPQMVYRMSDVIEPFVSENAKLWQETEADLLDQARRMVSTSPLIERLEQVLLSLFGHSDPTLHNVCGILKVSKSTLVRHLRSDGTTFQAVLDTLRRGQALNYLRNTDLSNQQIAHRIGYNDPNAFHRAFKKWTGETPGDTRAKLRGSARVTSNVLFV